MSSLTEPHRIDPGHQADLAGRPSREDGGLAKSDATKQLRKLIKRLDALQELMYAESKHSLLVVFQAMDAGGKDSTIRNVLGPLNPQGVRVASFKQPSTLERAHDFLWRIHQQCPGGGHIGIFNRSHYEDVLVVRVKNLVEPAIWKRRFEHINAFEKLLTDEGTVIVKFFLHISRKYQRKRLQRRLDRPDKHWKFDPSDLAERAHWDAYQQAFEEALTRCSTPWAPWYVVPAERRWYRNLIVAKVLVDTLESLKMQYPEPKIDPATIQID